MATVDTRGSARASTSGVTDAGRRAGEGTSIVLIDGQPLRRECLCQWLQDGSYDLRVVSVSSPAGLLDCSRSLNAAQLIVFSIGAASVKDPEVRGQIRLLRRHVDHIALVLLTDREDLDEIVEAIEQGVRGYIPTSLEPSEAAAAIQCVVAGGTFVPASALIKFFARDRQHAPQDLCHLDKDPFESLTPRESEVLARLRQGKPNKVIAYELDISESTVKVFVRRILVKLHASNRTEVASLVRRRTNPDGAGDGTREVRP